MLSFSGDFSNNFPATFWEHFFRSMLTFLGDFDSNSCNVDFIFNFSFSVYSNMLLIWSCFFGIHVQCGFSNADFDSSSFIMLIFIGMLPYLCFIFFGFFLSELFGTHACMLCVGLFVFFGFFSFEFVIFLCRFFWISGISTCPC